MNDEFRSSEDERAPELKSDLEAQLDKLGDDPGQVGNRSAGQAGDSQTLSSEEDATDESVEELADTEQALEAAAVEGVEDAADHPERPVHTHEEYGRPDDVPPKRNRDAASKNVEPAEVQKRKTLSHLREPLYWTCLLEAGKS